MSRMRVTGLVPALAILLGGVASAEQFSLGGYFESTYNSNFQNLEFIQDPAGNSLVRTEDDFLNDSRQLFVKFSYLFRP